jgi:hypothetical protein
MIELSHAIQALRPNSEFTYENDDYSTIQWQVLEGKAPTIAEVNAKIAELQAAETAAETQKAAQKQALLDRLGITADEAKLLLA